LAVIFALKILRRNMRKLPYYYNSQFLYIVLTFSPSALFGKITPLLSEINYPWTLLAIMMFLISLLAGYLSRQGKILTLVAMP